MIEAADFVLVGKHDFAGARVGHLLETELLVHVGTHQELLRLELGIHFLIAGDVDRHMVRMLDRLVVGLLDEVEVLIRADGHARHFVLAALGHLRGCEDHLVVERGDGFRGADRDPEIHVGNCLGHPAAELARGMHPERVAPGRGDAERLSRLLEREFRPLQFARHPLEIAQRCLDVRHADADLARKGNRFAARQVELLSTGIDPHVPRADHPRRVAGKAEPLAEEQHRRAVLRDAVIDVFELCDGADFRRRERFLGGHVWVPFVGVWNPRIIYRALTPPP